MTKLSLIVLSLFFVMAAEGQEPPPPDSTLVGEAPVGTEPGVPVAPLTKPKGRQKQKNNLQPNESSSFIGDPDNVDPLNPNRDNIKDDNEPVLDDIKDVLNADMAKKAEAASGDGTVTPSDVSTGQADGSSSVVDGSAVAAAAAGGSNLTSDDPDLDLEKKFHNIYQRYNKNPTPSDAWAAASSKQTARLYEVQKGDTLWSISQVLFGDPNFWPKLWAINKQGILNPHFINPKMKIYFYEGDESNSPTLSIGQQETFKSESPAMGDLGGSSAEGSLSKAPQVNELQPVNESLRVSRNLSKPLPMIPDTLPVGRNRRFYEDKTVQAIRLDLATARPNIISFKNNVIVSDSVIKSDVELKDESKYRAACSAGRAFGNLKLNNGPLEGEYELYERLDGFNSVAGHKEVYRQIGTAEAFKGFLKITECIGLNSEFLVMNKGRMREFVTTQVTDEASPHIVGGFDYRDKEFFSLLQFAFVDFGPKSFEVGGTYSSISSETASPNGELSVIEKFGSYAFVVFTSVTDLIVSGDRVETPEEMAAAPAATSAEPSTESPALEL